LSWLRLDDGFTKHPKFAGWTTAQKWAWLEVMEYCARYDTGGRIPDDFTLLPRSTTPKLLALAESSGWIDREADQRMIHDWPLYSSSSIADKVAYYLGQYPDASANEIVRAVKANRQLVITEVKRLRGGSETGSSETRPSGSGGTTFTGSESGSESGSKNGSRAREPVPSRPKELPSVLPAVAQDAEDGRTDDIEWPNLVKDMPT
jgi:hypothetical protein